MTQAARSGKQNIGEGSIASATSKQTEIVLTNVARGSLEELELDYLDFLRKRKLKLWEKDHKLVKRLRELNRTPRANYETFRKAIENPDPEICANTMITLIRIALYLLSRQIYALEQEFLKEGGIKERMLKARLKQKQSGNI
jgi:four helix bundle suffix protein